MPKPSDNEFPIEDAAKASGVSASVLRMWEIRYGWPRPQRHANGYRFYTLGEVEQVREIHEATKRGFSLRELIVDGVPTIPRRPMSEGQEIERLHRMVAELRYLLAMPAAAYLSESGARLRLIALSPGPMQLRAASLVEQAHRERDAARDEARRCEAAAEQERAWARKARRLLVVALARLRLWRTRANRVRA